MLKFDDVRSFRVWCIVVTVDIVSLVFIGRCRRDVNYLLFNPPCYQYPGTQCTCATLYRGDLKQVVVIVV